MKTLGGSYLKFFISKQREKERVILCSREIALRQETGFLVHRKRVRDGFSQAVSFQPKYFHFISAASSDQTNVENEEILTISSDQPKTVHVRLKLQKECAFGQQFLIVGDDPIVGLWNPSDGVPLNWSEGHVWTAEMDIPIGKVIKYKFILKGNTGTISWQPGPDRILETWDTEKTVSVSEDWDNPELQNIVEEELVADLKEESLINSDLLIVAENLNQPVVEEGNDAIKEIADANDHTNHSDKPSALMVAENISEEMGEQDLSSCDKGSGLMSVTDKKHEEMTLGNNGRVANGSNSSSLKDETRPFSDEGVGVLVPGLVQMPLEEIETDKKHEETTLGNNGRVANGSNSSSLKDETRPFSDEGVRVLVPGLVQMPLEEIETDKKHEEMTLGNNGRLTIGSNSSSLKDETKTVSDEVVPVLVPGLVLMPLEEIEAEEVNGVENNIVENTTTESDEIEDSTETELKDEYVSASVHSTEASEMMVDEKQQLYGKEQLESNVLESDMQWGRRTLQKFLANLGFIQHYS